jgi:DNA-binding beta-propeller fold protein YncE
MSLNRHAAVIAIALGLMSGIASPAGPASPPPATPPPAAQPPAAQPPAAVPVAGIELSMRGVALPGAPAEGGVLMDYIAYDRAHRRVWVPAGNTGRVDVIDTTSDAVSQVTGFATTEMERHGTKRTVGPSAVTVGDGFVYIGNRGDRSVSEVDAGSLRRGASLVLDAMPDGLAYVAATREVWATTPGDQSIVVLDASVPGKLTKKTAIKLEGDPEGFAVDDRRGLFFTNLEDKDRTLAIDLKTRAVTKTWRPECGEAGPRGLALDAERNFLLVACTNRVVVLDSGHDGRLLSSLDTGDGVDGVDYVATRHEVYAAAGRAAKFTLAGLDAQGGLTSIATLATSPGARNPAATEDGSAYLTDAPEGKVLVVVQKRR